MFKDQKAFEEAYNEKRKLEMGRLFYKKSFPLWTSKVTKKATKKTMMTDVGVPYSVVIDPAKSKVVFNTNNFNSLIVAFLEYHGHSFRRVSSEGRYRKDIGYIKSPNKGFSDVHGIMNGRAIYIETKQANESHLKSQKEFKQWVEKGGGIYITLRSFEELLKWYYGFN